METDQILFKLYTLSGIPKASFLDRIELGKSSVYDILKLENPKHIPDGKNRSIEFVRAWISATRPTNRKALLEWLNLVVQLLIEEDDLDLLLAHYDEVRKSPSQVSELPEAEPVMKASFLPEFFGNLFRFKERQ